MDFMDVPRRNGLVPVVWLAIFLFFVLVLVLINGSGNMPPNGELESSKIWSGGSGLEAGAGLVLRRYLAGHSLSATWQ